MSNAIPVSDLTALLPVGVWAHWAKLKTSLHAPYKRHYGRMEDLVRMNWAFNARFNAGKLYVIRFNPDIFEQADGMWSRVPLMHRLCRLLSVLLGLYEQDTLGTEHARIHYLYYSSERLSCFWNRRDCLLWEVQKDVEACLVF